MKITLQADRLHWISDDGTDDPSDLCAHSPVVCEINDVVIVRPEDGDWTVSASAIFLLRALGRDHTSTCKVGDQLFPCCGHGIYDVGEPEVVICGCPSGIDFEIRRVGNTFQITTEAGKIIDVPEGDWKRAVLAYSSQIMNFYTNSQTKKPHDEEEGKGLFAMMSEWRRLHHTYKEEAEQDVHGNTH